MGFRKLRIAWSVGCGIGCLLLIALWVRSYYTCDIFRWNHVSIETERGILYLVRDEPNPGFVDEPSESGWIVAELSDVDDQGSLANMMTARDGTRKTIETMEMPGAKVIAIKINALLFLSSALGAISLVRWSQFSLRTLLIATTLIAVVLGSIMYLAKG